MSIIAFDRADPVCTHYQGSVCRASADRACLDQEI